MDIPNSYRIMKLTSGENLICEIKNSSGKKFHVKRPMVIRTTVQFDHRGRQSELTILRDWLYHSLEIETKIPSEYVLNILTPSHEIVHLYEKEKEREDIGVSTSYQPLDSSKGLIDNIEKEIRAMLGEKEEDEEDEEKSDMLSEKEELIIMSLAIPFEHLKKMLENSIITEEDLKEAMGFGLSKSPMEEISEDKDTSSETDREDYGSKWTDWSPYVEDWLKDDEPEK